MHACFVDGEGGSEEVGYLYGRDGEGVVVSYPDPNVHVHTCNNDHRLQYDMTYNCKRQSLLHTFGSVLLRD